MVFFTFVNRDPEKGILGVFMEYNWCVWTENKVAPIQISCYLLTVSLMPATCAKGFDQNSRTCEILVQVTRWSYPVKCHYYCACRFKDPPFQGSELFHLQHILPLLLQSPGRFNLNEAQGAIEYEHCKNPEVRTLVPKMVIMVAAS